MAGYIVAHTSSLHGPSNLIN